MEHIHEPKPMRLSRIQLAQMMQPEHANSQGNVHGGWIMKLVDEAGRIGFHTSRRPPDGHSCDRPDGLPPTHPYWRFGLVQCRSDLMPAIPQWKWRWMSSPKTRSPGSKSVRTQLIWFMWRLTRTKNPPAFRPWLAETPEEQARMDAASDRQKRRFDPKGKSINRPRKATFMSPYRNI